MIFWWIVVTCCDISGVNGMGSLLRGIPEITGLLHVAGGPAASWASGRASCKACWSCETASGTASGTMSGWVEDLQYYWWKGKNIFHDHPWSWSTGGSLKDILFCCAVWIEGITCYSWYPAFLTGSVLYLFALISLFGKASLRTSVLHVMGQAVPSGNCGAGWLFNGRLGQCPRCPCENQSCGQNTTKFPWSTQEPGFEDRT